MDKNLYSLDKLSQKQLDAVQKMAKCKDAEPCVRMLMQIIDGQVPLDRVKEFESHIEDCTGCFKEYELSITIREIVKESICRKYAPATLENQIRKKIQSTGV